MSPARVLAVHCHPSPESLTAAIRDTVCAAVRGRGDVVDLLDLLAKGFEPATTRPKWEGCHNEGPNLALSRPTPSRWRRPTR